jgi:conjugative relaxase-like TrwC/TraI family protein
MGFLVEPVSYPRRIEYLRHHYDPAKYHPKETEFISQPGHQGRLWASLGIIQVGLPEIRKLAHGIHPLTGKSLTARMNGRSSSKQHRTAYLSVVLNVPKSISIMSELGGDRRLRECVRQTAQATLEHSEEFYSGFRVRKLDAPDHNHPRHTGQMAWLTRLENDSRYADPHLHVHAEVFNATYDPSDPKRPFKALDMRPFLSGQLLLSRHFDHELSRAIHALGYTIQKTATSSFEIDGVSEALIARFSKGRTAVKAIEDANGHGAPNRPSIRAILRQARKSRPKKTLRTQHWLRDHWLTQVSLAEFRQLRSLIAASAKQLEASATLREARELLEPVNPSCRRQGPNPVASHQGTDLRNTGSFNFN